MAALVGGGSGLPKPGEVSRAHRGVLFLDELGEFSTQTLDSLRQPVEEGSVSIVRQAGSFRFPSDVQLIAASNPCPCGYLGDWRKKCGCLDGPKARYAAKLTGPLADRFDIRVDMERLNATSLMGAGGESSADVQKRVIAARRRQTERGAMNRELVGSRLDDATWTAAAASELRTAAEESSISARGWDRVRRVALTIADLAGSEVIEGTHVKEALDMRGGLT
jgi:magnesium chelatase family protein